MKNKFLSLGLALLLALCDTAWAVPELQPLPYEPPAAHLSAEILTRYHYRHIPLDDALSKQIFSAYLKGLDEEKMIFLQSDIDHFGPDRTKLDDALLDENLGIPFAIFDLYQQRMTQRLNYARSLLPHGFDFTKEESYEISRKDEPWPKSTAELNDLWRKRVKNEWLRLKLAGKDRKSIVSILDKRYQLGLRRLSQLKSEDAFQNFMNAYAMTIDPHTNYFGVRESQDFDIAMSLSLVGIGAVLYEKDDYTTIRELLPGGAAALSGKLKPGDRIVGVGQGSDGPVEDIVGWRIDDAVAIIRGKENTVVVLDVLPADAGADGKHELVRLARKKITLAEQSASKSVIKVKDGHVTRRIGVITLPSFYEDFAAHAQGDANYKSASRDVARLLEELKKEHVDGVLVDLRNDGGGSLHEAIALTGLFIDRGPVVQERDSRGQVAVKSDTDRGVAWSGPMGVLINHGSASASEIFTAAIQDYGRGVVMGARSFGKGTVQTIVNLDEMAKNPKPEYGELKMTIAEFFRINGGSTQLRGVTPDVSFPAPAEATLGYGESSYDNALPWTQIKPADYQPVGNLSQLLPRLVERHKRRIGHDIEFRYLEEDIAEADKMRKENMISLNEADRRKAREAREARDLAREKARKGAKPAARDADETEDDGMLPSERKLSTELAREKALKSVKDIELTEAAHVVGDEAALEQAHPALAGGHTH
ncbi:MAG TPA: carboxy terminal-processing peptidase [Gallionellaceae bacterium]|nr:carboxy terminal-processing peptidase [Gallionellaceae bacterium]